MIKRLIAMLILSHSSLSYAQMLKTEVLVIGGTPGGLAAAIQSARSKVKTTLAIDGQAWDVLSAGEAYNIAPEQHLGSGIWGELLDSAAGFSKKLSGQDRAYDAKPVADQAKLGFIVKKLTDSLKNLTIVFNAKLAGIKKDGDHWEVTFFKNTKTIPIKTRIIVDATQTGQAVSKAGGKLPAAVDNQEVNSVLKAYRTSIASGDGYAEADANHPNTPGNNYPPYPAWYIPINAVLVSNLNNVLRTEKILPGNKTAPNLPIQLSIGQGAGAIAAYCAFYKTTTKNLNVRKIQAELLDFGEALLPVSDVTPKDPDWRAIQQICATGLLKVRSWHAAFASVFVFMPDTLVNTAEIQPVLQEIYSRAFLWFNREKPGEKLTIGNLLSFISDYSLTDPEVLKSIIQKRWKSQYKFKLDFDIKRPVTRREFAVLANRYLNPFARTVDLDGRLLN